MTALGEATVRYTLDNPPPADPPGELTGGHGIWRVMHRTWTDHHPVDTPTGRRCRVPACQRPWGTDGCWGFRAAADILNHMHRYPDGVGELAYPRLPIILLEGAPRLTRVSP